MLARHGFRKKPDEVQQEIKNHSIGFIGYFSVKRYFLQLIRQAEKHDPHQEPIRVQKYFK